MHLPGVDVGHWTDTTALTGVTVIVPRDKSGATCGLDIRGGAPGSRETELLRLERTVERVHAIVLTGGSAFGLAAADGVMRELAELGRGLAVGGATIPIVPASVVFDLTVGDGYVYPDATAGKAAFRCARAEVHSGPVGAGAGASVGKMFGRGRAMRGGFGVASRPVGRPSVAAAVIVNALGDIVAANGQTIAGARGTGGFMNARLEEMCDAGLPSPSNTTLAVVVTDAALDTIGCTRLAMAAHDGMARAIRPAHTVYDGDTAYALSTGAAEAPFLALEVAAADVVAEAIRAAVLHAPSLSDLPGAADWQKV